MLTNHLCTSTFLVSYHVLHKVCSESSHEDCRWFNSLWNYELFQHILFIHLTYMRMNKCTNLYKVKYLWDREAWHPGVLQSMASQRVRHNLVTEQQQNTSVLTIASSDQDNRILWALLITLIPAIGM